MVSPSTQCGLVKVAAGGGGSTGSCFREEECGQECSTVTSTQCSTTTETQCQVQHVMCNTHYLEKAVKIKELLVLLYV